MLILKPLQLCPVALGTNYKLLPWWTEPSVTWHLLSSSFTFCSNQILFIFPTGLLHKLPPYLSTPFSVILCSSFLYLTVVLPEEFQPTLLVTVEITQKSELSHWEHFEKYSIQVKHEKKSKHVRICGGICESPSDALWYYLYSRCHFHPGTSPCISIN